MKRSGLGLAAVVLVAALAAAAGAAGRVVTVTPGHFHGWQPSHESCGTATTGSQDFVTGPGSPPLGTGSYRFEVGANGDSYETLRSHVFDGRKLSDLTTLRYSTYEEHFGSGGQAVYIDLAVDRDGNGSADDTLTFEPIYQTGSYSGDTVPNQGNVVLDTWQTWDALIGGWWSEDAGTSGPPLVTLAHYISMHPDVRVARTAGGSLRMAAGCGGAAWAGFVGEMDAIALDAHSLPGRTYDFETSSPPPPPPPPPPPGHKVAMCHKGHTIVVDRHAVRAHLRHGDTLGRCDREHGREQKGKHEHKHHGDHDHGDGD